MIKGIKDIFSIQKKPVNGLLKIEWVVLIYLIATLGVVLFCWIHLPKASEMLEGRISLLILMALCYGVYRLWPSRLTMLVRQSIHLCWLSWWYPDTYELNRLLPNLDYIMASWEETVFGCQPALLFQEAVSWNWFSELMCLAYESYFPCIVAVVLFYFFKRYNEFSKTVFIILTGFFIFYCIFIVFPVTGPQYYYEAVGVDLIRHGDFPDMGSYFFNHDARLPEPGHGVFHDLLIQAHRGERPTAAFPSSHVGISAILLMLIIHTRSKRFLYIYLPIFLLLCCSTVYIRAHYTMDAISGLIVGVVMYFALNQIKVREDA